MKWLAPPGPDEIGVVSLFIAPSHEEPDAWPGASHGSDPIGIIATRSRVAWLVYGKNPCDKATQSFFAEQRARLSLANVPKARGYRSVAWGNRESGDRFFIEFAWQDPDPA